MLHMFFYAGAILAIGENQRGDQIFAAMFPMAGCMEVHWHSVTMYYRAIDTQGGIYQLMHASGLA